MQNNSLEHINPLNLKKFVRKLSVVSSRHTKKQSYVKADINPTHADKIKQHAKDTGFPNNKNYLEKFLRTRIYNLEQELMQAREERDTALEENKHKVNELNIALLSVKERMKEFIEAKKAREKRIRHLEHKIRKKVK